MTPGPLKALFVGPHLKGAVGGATVKNRLLVDELQEQGTSLKVVDTGGKGLLARSEQAFGLVAGVIWSRQIVLSVSRNGAKSLVSALGLLGLVIPRLRFVLVAVGSSLPDVLRASSGLSGSLYESGLARCQRVYVENDAIRLDLQEMSVERVARLPNPRPRTHDRWTNESLSNRRFLFVSRVTPEKGVDRAMAAVERLRAEGLEVTLDIYGPVAVEYSAVFDELLGSHPGSRYCGVADPSEIPALLAGHAGLLLPTTWQSEGMPGILVEAGMVGAPVIAADVPTIAEMIRDGESGLLVEPTDIDSLARAARKLVCSPGVAAALGAGLADAVSDYEVTAVVSRLRSDLTSMGWR